MYLLSFQRMSARYHFHIGRCVSVATSLGRGSAWREEMTGKFGEYRSLDMV